MIKGFQYCIAMLYFAVLEMLPMKEKDLHHI